MKRLVRPAPLTVIVATIALVGLLSYGLVNSRGDTTLSDAVARGERPPAPPLELPPLDGRGTRSLADYEGQVVVLNVWASWCTPCRDESPLLERWHRKLQPRGGTVLGIDVQDVESDARAFIREFGLTYPHLRDKEGDDVRSQYGVVGYPETFVIDRKGRVAALFRGPVDEEFMRRSVEPLLEERQ